jgi:antitoxin component YwqK of YwqJK toxin-antitoxin module
MQDNKHINQRNLYSEKHGPWEEYYLDGKIRYKGIFNNGKRDGTWERYNSNGRLYFKGTYKNNELHGYCEWTDEQTGKIIKGSFLNRRRIGLFKIYDKTHSLLETKYYAR